MPDPARRTSPSQPSPAPDATITVRLPQALKNKLQRKARREREGVSELVRRGIAWVLK